LGETACAAFLAGFFFKEIKKLKKITKQAVD
jgi:hypothetical protein